MRNERPTSRIGIFGLGLLVGGLFGYWLHGIAEELAAMDGGYPFSYDAYVWLAALVVALFVVFRRRG